MSLVMPYNKKLWSVSLAFVTVGISGLALAFTMFIIDIIE